MITVIGFSGSLRQGSYNAALLRAAGSLMPSDSELRIESIAGIPLYDGIWRQACCNRWRLTGRFRYDPVAECVAARLSDLGSGPLVWRASSRIARGGRHRRERRDHRCCYPRQHSQVHGGLRCLCSWAKAIVILSTCF